MSTSELIAENMTLKVKLAAFAAEHGLVLNTIRIFGFQIQYKRLPDILIDSEAIARTIAQIDIEQSNSMVEMLFHRMKHR